jgi:hypothetical protein
MPNIKHLATNFLRYRKLLYFLLFSLIISHSYSIYITTGIFNYTFIDYRVWYSVGQTIINHGYDNIYNIELLKEFQKQVIDYSGYKPITFPTIQNQTLYALPYVYPAIFSVLFMLPGHLLMHIDATLICILFILTTISSLFFLQNCFNKDQKSFLSTLDLTAAAILSTGTYFSLAFLNPSILLCIFCAVGLIFHKKDKPILSGLAYSLCFLKPNIAIWILIGLFFSKQVKALLSMIVGILILIVTSAILSGLDANISWINILLNYKSEYGNWAESMPNIRMIFIRTLQITASNVLAYIICILVTATLFGLLYRVLKKKNQNYSKVMLSFSILSLLLSFHSHAHTSSIVLPFGLFYLLQNNHSQTSFYTFLYGPIAIFLMLDSLFLDLAIAHLGCAIALVITSINYLFFISHQTDQHS